MKVYLYLMCLSLFYGCNSLSQNVKYYKDYSFLEGKGIEEVSVSNIVNGAVNPLFIVRYPDSSYQEVLLRDSIKENIRMIKVFKLEDVNVYHFLFSNFLPGAREDLFLAYKRDSCLKEYIFGLEYPDGNHLITGSVSSFSMGKNKVYFFLVNTADTVNFVNKIWTFEEHYLGKKVDSLLNVKNNKVFTLDQWVKLHK